MKKLVSIRALAWKLGIEREQLEIVAANIRGHYRQWVFTDPRTGKTRAIKAPSNELKAIQKRIAKRLLAVEFGEEVHGGVRHRSPKTNALRHVAKPLVVAIDVRRFFPSVRPGVVFRLLRDEFDCGREVAALVTRLVTFEGQLPQGAPTSVAIANALMRVPVDEPTRINAARHGDDFTRFIDDLSLSGQNPQQLINPTIRQLSTRGLAVSRKKLKIMPRSVPQEITGLLVNGKKPSLAKWRRDRVRAAIHELRGMAVGALRNKALASARGRIAYVKQFNTGTARRLERQMAEMDP